jgi:hypothetical protein
MATITDDQMQATLATSKSYTLLILKPGPNRNTEGADALIWEHGRRNMSLRADGLLSIVCPVGSPEVAGIGIFNLGLEETSKIMDDDPAVAAGVLVYDVNTCRSFPGDALPA